MSTISLRYEDEFSKPISVYYGPIWNILFIGSIYMLIAKDFKNFFLTIFFKISFLFLLFLVVKNFLLFILIGLPIWILINLYLVFNYSNMIIRDYLKKGYVPYGEESTRELINKGLYFKVI